MYRESLFSLASLTRKGVTFFREDKPIAEVNLVYGALGDDSFNGTYLTGTKVQPIAYSGDGSRAYIAGNGAVYVIDLVRLDLIATVSLPAGRNITSLVALGKLLLIGEGDRYASGGGFRLLAMNVDPGSKDYHRIVSLAGTGIESAPLGISGMAIGSDKRTLVVATPKTRGNLHDPHTPGDILIFDLDTLDLKRATIAAPIRAQLPSDGNSGKSPQTVTATADPNRYLVASVGDYNRGLGTLTLTRNAQGAPTSARLNALDLSQPTSAIKRDRLDIQRAQSAVLIEREGIEYAIVADDNYNFNDPYWRAMFEAPTFVQMSPYGPPTAVGGSASAKKVNVGGKLGVIQDPFGKSSGPVFLGATEPLDGYGIANLSLSADSKVLIGQLIGRYGTVDPLTQNISKGQAWNVDRLITAARAASQGERLSRHIDPAAAGGGGGTTPPGDSDTLFTWLGKIFDSLIPSAQATMLPAGTAAQPAVADLKIEGRMGDVIEVDLKKLLRQKLGLLGEEVLALTDFKMLNMQWLDGLNLEVIKTADKLKLLSRDAQGNEADFTKEGRFYVVPRLTEGDAWKLRRGQTVDDKFSQFDLTYRPKAGEPPKTIRVDVTAKDFASSAGAFFGDRDLNNPGYSKFTLKAGSTVGYNQNADPLDVWRVEQRLKYLGFPAMGFGCPTPADNQIQEFKVDGEFGLREELALKLFEKIVRGESDFVANITSGADGWIDASDAISLNWLNAYNAPHWMNIGAQMDSGAISNWYNTQKGLSAKHNDVEKYGTSWMRDWLAAKNYAPVELHGNRTSYFNGAADANGGFTQALHPIHGLGMSLDLGLQQYIGPLQQEDSSQQYPSIIIGDTGGWSVDNAVAFSELLSDNAPLDGQRQAIRDFLALYAVTRSDGRSGLTSKIVNGSAVLNALFGDGSANNGLIKNVVIGGTGIEQNPYADMRLVLERLGMTPVNRDGHHTHFHVNLRPPQRVDIKPTQNLMADDATHLDSIQSEVNDELRTAAQAFLDQVRPVLNFGQGELTMFALDMPDVSPQYAPVVIAQTSQVKQAAIGIDRTVGVCQLIQNPDVPGIPGSIGSGVNSISPLLAVKNYFRVVENKVIEASGRVSVLDNPSHGVLKEFEGENRGNYMYVPAPDFSGQDRITLLVEVGGFKVKVIYFLHIQNRPVLDTDNKEVCPTRYWKISLNSEDPTADLITFQSPLPWTTYLAQTAKANLTFADLSGEALGQTTANTITLDTDAAGHGWFLDTTPWENEEFVATSNSNEWVARSGSEAAGKMDLLTVLLHEYGHVLGLDHSETAHSLMSEDLKPGMRRTVSVEDMQALWNYLGDKLPSDPSDPFNPLPLSSSLLFGFTRLRREATGQGINLPPLPSDANALSVTPAPTYSMSPQYASALHEGLYNGDFAIADTTSALYGWDTRGTVDLSSQYAELREDTRAMSGLTQTFVKPEGIVGLRFTLTGADFGADPSAPPDAFEVALLDALTGQSVAGAAGL